MSLLLLWWGAAIELRPERVKEELMALEWSEDELMAQDWVEDELMVLA